VFNAVVASTDFAVNGLRIEPVRRRVALKVIKLGMDAKAFLVFTRWRTNRHGKLGWDRNHLRRLHRPATADPKPQREHGVGTGHSVHL
jgi:hypothetical protein